MGPRRRCGRRLYSTVFVIEGNRCNMGAPGADFTVGAHLEAMTLQQTRTIRLAGTGRKVRQGATGGASAYSATRGGPVSPPGRFPALRAAFRRPRRRRF